MKSFLIVIAVIAVIVLGYFGYRSLYKATPATTFDAVVTTNSVVMKNFAFTPNNISVTSGQEVSFLNNDAAAHHIVADDNSFDSGLLASGKTFKKTFSVVGTFSYHCSIHPSMIGQVVVK